MLLRPFHMPQVRHLCMLMVPSCCMAPCCIASLRIPDSQMAQLSHDRVAE